MTVFAVNRTFFLKHTEECQIFNYHAKDHASFSHYLASVVGHKLSHLNLPKPLNQIKPNSAEMVLWWSPFKILSDSQDDSCYNEDIFFKLSNAALLSPRQRSYEGIE